MVKQARRPPVASRVTPAIRYGAIVGRTIAARRSAVAIDQAQLAAAVGVNQSTWSRIERGQSALTVDQLRIAAAALKVTPASLLDQAEQAVRQARERGIRVLTSRETSTIDAGVALIGGAALGALVVAALTKK